MSKLNSIVLFVSIFMLASNLVRDLQLAERQIGDLRNRIVGARLQKDGRSPYFYKWKEGEGTRYYDPLNDGIWRVSTCTASPFFHTLLYPLTELPYNTTSKLWVVILYTLLVGTTVLAVIVGNRRILPLTCFVSVCFTFTETWLDTIVTKQSYLFIPFFAMLIYFFIKYGKNALMCIGAGVLSTFLLLTKPNTVFFFLPLMLIQGRFSLKAKVSFFLPCLLGLILIVFSPRLDLWRDYLAAMNEHVKVHQGLHPAVQLNDKANFAELEGFRLPGYDNKATREYTAYVEHGNFFWIIYLLFDYHITPRQLSALVLVAIMVCLVLFYCIQKKASDGFPLEAVLLLGYCLYMISDIGVPVYRGHYNVVQWLFPLLLIPLTFQVRYLWLYLLMLIALILNIHYKPFLPMQHVLAEYLWLASFLVYSFIYQRTRQRKVYGA